MRRAPFGGQFTERPARVLESINEGGANFLMRGIATGKNQAPDEVSGADQYLICVLAGMRAGVALALYHSQDVLIVFRHARLDDILVDKEVDSRLCCWKPAGFVAT